MEQAESLFEYYTSTNKELPKDLLRNGGTKGHFNVLKRENCSLTLPFVRRNYYKICLLDSKAILQTAHQTIQIDRPSIFFSIPEIDYGWQTISDRQNGYVCLFNDEYLSSDLKSSLRKLNSLFRGSAYPFLFLEQREYELFSLYFQHMHKEYQSSFEYKQEVIQNLLQLIIYIAIKIQRAQFPALTGWRGGDRLVNLFLAYLEKQFPIDSPKNPIQYKAPAHFAKLLHVHVNHLNHSLKTRLGKSTTQLINERIISEAIDLLKNTDWNISEIASGLGFEYLQHFTYFFKKRVGVTPHLYRQKIKTIWFI